MILFLNNSLFVEPKPPTIFDEDFVREYVSLILESLNSVCF